MQLRILLKCSKKKEDLKSLRRRIIALYRLTCPGLVGIGSERSHHRVGVAPDRLKSRQAQVSKVWANLAPSFCFRASLIDHGCTIARFYFGENTLCRGFYKTETQRTDTPVAAQKISEHGKGRNQRN